MIDFADATFRGGAFAALSLLSLRFALARPASARSFAASLLGLCMIAYVFASAPTPPPAPDWLGAALRWTPTAAPVLLWLVGLSIFDDRFRFRSWMLLLAVLTTVPALIPSGQPLRGVVVAGLYLHLIWVAFATSEGDLVASRIVFRRAFFVVAAVTGLSITYVEIIVRTPPSDVLHLVQATALFLLSSGFLYWSHSLASEFWPNAQSEEGEPTSTKPNAPDPLSAKLDAAMREEIWRTEGLSIGALAAHLRTPEHRLRRLINQTRGHRNFASFVNAARVEAAAAALLDPTQADKQILTIAHESGFASLGPFNRAFRAVKGVSPSDWRAGARRI